MTISIHISPELNDRLKEQARQLGMAPEQYAERLLQQHVPAPNAASTSAVELDALLDQYFAAQPEKIGSLSTDFGRSDIYLDHD